MVTSARTLNELLASVADTHGSVELLFKRRGTVEHVTCYGELYSRAQSCLAWLRNIGATPGSFLLVQVASEHRQIELFWAALLGGIIPIITPRVNSWTRDNEAKSRFINVCRQIKCGIIIQDKEAENTYAIGGEFRVVKDFYGGSKAFDKYSSEYLVGPEDLAFIQFSSGSTGNPTGVQLTHGNIICNLRDIVKSGGFHSADIGLNWMPYSHDMGLIGFHLVSAAVGAKQVKIDVADFMADPRSWLREIEFQCATFSGGPNFAFQLLLEKVDEEEARTFDLSSLRRLFNGAEPISAQVMRNFLARFSPAGFKEEAMVPCYGMAEACVGVAYSPIGEKPRVHQFDRQLLFAQNVASSSADSMETIEFVDVGVPIESTKVRIVDQGGEVVGERIAGEIEIKGGNVTSGFISSDDIASRFREGGWLKTGDLGVMIEGRLTVIGRRKEVIFINGRNIIAQDLEEAIRRDTGLKYGSLCACGVTDPISGIEAVVVFVATRARDPSALIQSVRVAASEFLGYPVAWVIPIPRIPRTTSGKLKRFELSREFLKGAYDRSKVGIAVNSTAIDIETSGRADDIGRIAEVWASVLKIPVAIVGADSSFSSLGGSSIQAMQMLHRIQAMTELPIDQTMLVECRTVREVAHYINRIRDRHELAARFSPPLDGFEQVQKDEIETGSV